MGKFPDVSGAAVDVDNRHTRFRTGGVWALLFLPAAHRDLDSAAELRCKGVSSNPLHRETKRNLSALMDQKSALGFANFPACKSGASTQPRD